MHIITPLMNSVMKTKAGQYLMGPYSPISPAMIATVSCLTKDGTNCAYYVTQSLNNERIPDDKRNFVAGLDLANGILNIITQLGFALYINAKIDKFYDSRIGSKLLKTLPQKIFSKYSKVDPKVTLESATSMAKGLNSAGKAGLAVLTTLLATQILCKRIIVPLIATPMATWFKNMFDKHGCGHHHHHHHPENKPLAQDTVSFNNKPEVETQTQKQLPPCFKQFNK